MEKVVGTVKHFYPKISVAVIEATDEIKVGDKIAIRGNTTNIEQVVESMEIEHQKVEVVKPGDSFGMKVIDRVREGDIVYKIENG
jgi:putative protease